MWDPQSDPLGIGLQQRAMQRRMSDAMQGLGQRAGAPLPDPQWDAYFQSVGENANGRQVKFGDSGTGPDALVNDPAYASQVNRQMPFALQGLQPSTQLGVPTRRRK